MDRLFPTVYTQGYTAALIDVLNIIDCIQDDLRIHKRKQNAKTYRAIVKCMLKNRAIFREDPDAFLRCNDNAEDGFEVYISRKGTYHLKESKVKN